MKYIKLTTIALLLCFTFYTRAQQATTSAGGDAIGGGGTVAYSVGQIVYTTIAGTNGSVAQGVQQPYEISIVLGLETNQISLNIQAYPNPTTDYLILNIDNTELSELSFQLSDVSGKLIESKKVSSTKETIHMEDLPSATYFLRVANSNQEIKIFKIIKN